MRLRILHETRYRFSAPVFLEPHLLRLMPRQDAGQHLRHFELHVDPAPAGQGMLSDASGNTAYRLWFDGLHAQLTIRTQATVDTLRANPFDYLLEPGGQRFPLELNGPETAAVQPCLQPEVAPRTAELTRDLLATHQTPQDFLSALTAWVHARIRIAPRQEPGVLEPDATLAAGAGACRDATRLFIAACRQGGLPARYVSGYCPADPDQSGELHAWPEIYLPGAGWRGYDPTLGLAVADGHVALCAAHAQDLTAPVCGTFRGTDVAAELTHHVSCTPED